MSYDLSASFPPCEHCRRGKSYVGWDWNFTSNSAPVWCAAGADLASFHGKPAGECAASVIAALAELQRDPDKYRAMDSPNGWGTYSDLLPALTRLLAHLLEWPEAIVEVSK